MSAAALHALSSSSAPGTVLDIVRRDGAVIIEDFLAPDIADRIHGEATPYVDATAVGKDRFSGTSTTRTGALVARSPTFREIISSQLPLTLAKDYLEPWCSAIQLSVSQIIRLKPGQGNQPLHRDRGVWPPLEGVEPQLNFIVALTEFTEHNGATVVVPGSHTWDKGRKPTPAETTCAAMARGSALVFNGSVLHGGGANDSQADRIALYFNYILGWLRQEENQYLSCPPRIAREFPRELQALIGYAHGSYALGYYTPPLAPGEGPEAVGPEFAVGHASASDGLGDNALLEATARVVGRYSGDAG